MNNLYIKFSLLFFLFCLFSYSVLAKKKASPSISISIDKTQMLKDGGEALVTVTLSDKSNGNLASLNIKYDTNGTGSDGYDFSLEPAIYYYQFKNNETRFTFKVKGVYQRWGSSDVDLRISIYGLQNCTAKGSQEVSLNIVNEFGGSYCSSAGNTSYNTGITLVDFNTLNNATPSYKTAGYNDFTSQQTEVIRGNVYDLTVNVNTDFGPFTIYAIAWIDWNHNFIFDDSEGYELDSAFDTDDGPTDGSPFSITVPSGAALGTTRMRVAAKWRNYPASCDTGFDGEVEDYTLNVIGNLEPTINSFTPAMACSNSSSHITITGTGLSNVSEVKIGDGSAGVESNSSTQIIVSLPTDATTGPISVKTPGGTGTSTDIFTVNSLPDDAGDIRGADIVFPVEAKTYVCDPINGATSYVWDLGGEIKTTTDPQLDYTFANDASPGDRVLTLKGVNECGEGAESAPLTVYVRYKDPCQTAIVNWDFNEPDLGSDNWQGYRIVNGWQSSLNNIEIWSDKMPNVPFGEQCCELNSIGQNEMWQNVFTVPGDNMRWSINYRFRTKDSESIEIRIGKEGSLVDITPISNKNGDGWVSHSGLYTVPDGQTITQFRIVSVNSSPGSRSSGNLIDDVRFYPIELDKEKPTFNCPTNSDQGCVDATSVEVREIGVTDLADNCTAVGDLNIEYKIENSNYPDLLVNFGDDPDGIANSEDASGFAFPIGMNTVTYRVTDKSDNSTTNSFTININRKPSPIGIFHD